MSPTHRLYPRGLAVAAALWVGLSGCVAEPRWKPGPRRVTTKVLDELGRESSATGANYQILGLGPRVVDPLTVAVDVQDTQDLTPQEKERRRAASIRNTFGSTVMIDGDFVTKRYFMAGEAAGIFKKLIGTKEPAAGGVAKIGGEGGEPCVLGTMMRDKQVELSYVEGFEQVPGLAYVGSQVAKKPLITSTADGKNSNDLVLVTATVDGLLAFERAMDLIFRNIPQVEIEVKVVEFTTSDSLSFGTGGGSGTGAVPPAVFNNLSGSKLVNSITSAFPLTPPAGSGLSSTGLFALGGSHDGWQLDATLQVLAAQGKADVLSNPRLVVRNGGTAVIATFTDYPFPKAKIVGVNSSTDVSFRPVGITLGIKPIIAGTDTVILQIHADVSAVTGFAPTEVVPTPIVSTRTAITQVHVAHGKATIIGGLKSKATFENESKIPILGDIPILGYLFRQSTTQTTETDLQFFITPWIRTGSQDELVR